MAAGKNIRRTCGLGNAAGVNNQIWFTKKSEVTAITAAASGVISGASAFTMATTPAAGTFNILELTPIANKKVFEVNPAGDADSPSWNVNITGFHPKMEGSKNDVFTSITGCEYIIVVQDKNTKRFLVGDINSGAYITVKPIINEGSNGYEITLTMEGLAALPYELASNVTLTVAADV
jgi:hypothetical protein